MEKAKERRERTESSISDYYTRRVESEEWKANMARMDAERETERHLAKAEVIAAESMEEEHEEARKNGYCCRFLVQTTLPHSKPPPGVYEFRRVNGDKTLTILSRSDVGLPYGGRPRQILAWVGHEAVVKRAPTIHAGDSLREFVTTKLGRKYSSGKRGAATTIRDQFVRTVSAEIQATFRRDGASGTKNISPIEQSILFWDPADHTHHVVDWQAEITLKPEFYGELISHPIPVCFDTLCGFHGPMQMDIYAWLTYRMSYLQKKTTVPWEGLHGQFGCGYPKTQQGMRDFRKFFLKSLRVVLQQYKTARVTPTAAGLVLEPSPTHVPTIRSLPSSKR